MSEDKAQTKVKIKFKSFRTKEFKKLFKKLDSRLQEAALEKYENFFQHDPYHPFLRGHEVEDQYRGSKSWSVWIDYNNRALAEFCVEDKVLVFTWYWIGSHENYNNRLGN